MIEDVGSFTDLLRTALGDRLSADASDFIGMVATDVVMEFPFSPAGLPTRLQGRDEISAHLSTLGKLIEFDRMSLSAAHPTADPEVMILEFKGFGKGVETDEPYEQRYISRIRIRDGQIIHYLDYWNPLVLLRTLKGPTIEQALAVEEEDGRGN